MTWEDQNLWEEQDFQQARPEGQAEGDRLGGGRAYQEEGHQETETNKMEIKQKWEKDGNGSAFTSSFELFWADRFWGSAETKKRNEEEDDTIDLNASCVWTSWVHVTLYHVDPPHSLTSTAPHEFDTDYGWHYSPLAKPHFSEP